MIKVASRIGAFAAVAMLMSGAAMAGDMPAGDAAKGEKVFNKCKACHTIEEGGQNKVGPNLHGIVGREAATVDGFRYGKSVQKAAEAIGTWEKEEIFEYLKDPNKFLRKVSGDKRARSKMTFKLPPADQRADVIAYLEKNS